MQSYPMIINGQPVLTEALLDVINPATGRPFAQVAAGDAQHAELAIAAAKAAFPGWSRRPDAERRELLHVLAGLLETHMPELMQLVTQESGKPLDGLNHVGSGMEVGGAMVWTRATAALDIPVDLIQDNEQARVEVHRKPLGVVASITPWNWPLMIAIWHIMPALRAGNTVVIKPASLTPVATLRFIALANQVLPAGVLNVITGDREVGGVLTSHPDVAKVVFTGSTPTGRHIMSSAAPTLKRLTLELGGNDAGIVLPDADPKAIAPRLFGAAFHNNGQTCACLKRLFVHESIYEELCAELARLAREVVVGDGLKPETQLGPVQNPAQRLLVHGLVEEARAKGARVLAGGEFLAGEGFFYAPTVIADACEGMRVVDEEQFGPVLPVIRYRSVEQALEQANRGENGLGGSVWSGNLALATEIAQRLECGTAWVNDHGALQPDAPFGGIKQSGLGTEFGLYGLEEFMNLQTVKVVKG